MTRAAAVPRLALLLAAVVLGLGSALALTVGVAAPAQAAVTTTVTTSASPATVSVPDTLDTETDPASPATGGSGVERPARPDGPRGTTDNNVSVSLEGLTDKPSTSVSVILAVTLLSLVPAIVFTCTSFTKILIVLSLTRNALGLQQTPPNQVLVGLALFLSIFIMSPTLSEIKEAAIDPYLAGTSSSAQAWEDGVAPLKEFMLKNTDDSELRMLTNIAKRDLPEDRDDVALDTLVPSFILSELKDAFTIGFIIFLPFLVIDIVVSGALMALGMMMMPPVMVSLPFKLLLFVLVNGWGLLLTALVASYGASP